jgi:hypothetical protein
MAFEALPTCVWGQAIDSLKDCAQVIDAKRNLNWKM